MRNGNYHRITVFSIFPGVYLSVFVGMIASKHSRYSPKLYMCVVEIKMKAKFEDWRGPSEVSGSRECVKVC